MNTDPAYTPLHTYSGLNAYLTGRRLPPLRHSIDDYLALDDDERAAYDDQRRTHHASGIFIKTRAVRDILDELDDIFDINLGATCGNTGLVVSGPATLGKTTIAKAAMLHTMARTIGNSPHWAEADLQPCVYIEIPATSTGRSLAAKLAAFLGMTVIPRDNMESILDRVVEQLIKSRTKLIVIDEIQRLTGRDRIGREAIDTLKTLHNQLATTTFLYSGIDVINSGVFAGDVGGQLLGRMEGYDVAPHRHDTASQKANWSALINQIEGNLRLLNHQPGTLEHHAEYLHSRSRGSIGRLMRVITKSANHAIRTATTPEDEQVTLASLQRVRLDMEGQAQLDAENHRKKKASTL